MIKVTPNINYKIKLTLADAEKFREYIQEYAQKPTQKLKMQMLRIYTPYIDRKVIADTYRKDISAEDYKQTLNLKLLEVIEQLMRRKFRTSTFPTRMLNQMSPTTDDIISKQYRIKETDNEAKEIVNPEEQTAYQKVLDILDLAKDFLKPREYEVLLKRAGGATFKSIAALINTSMTRAETIYYEAISKIKAHINQNVLEETFYDDKYIKRKIIPADEPLISEERLATLTMCTPPKDLEADMV